MNVDGDAGARLFAAQVYAETLDKIEIAVDAGSGALVSLGYDILSDRLFCGVRQRVHAR